MHLMSQAAAERIGINPTDLNCLNILSLGGELTAGQLATATGLTTASITGVVDRLEQAGYVRRERDSRDRRRVVIHLIIEPVLRDVVAVFAPVLEAWKAVADGYTDAELELIIGFQAKSEQVLRDNVARFRQSATPET
jgi:DNA-binding transcriptional ArsR family regulator